MIDFRGSQFEREIILWGVRWYVAYPISYRQIEEVMGEPGIAFLQASCVERRGRKSKKVTFRVSHAGQA
jgi:transposase-like protein